MSHEYILLRDSDMLLSMQDDMLGRSSCRLTPPKAGLPPLQPHVPCALPEERLLEPHSGRRDVLG